MLWVFSKKKKKERTKRKGTKRKRIGKKGKWLLYLPNFDVLLCIVAWSGGHGGDKIDSLGLQKGE